MHTVSVRSAYNTIRKHIHVEEEEEEEEEGKKRRHEAHETDKNDEERNRRAACALSRFMGGANEAHAGKWWRKMCVYGGEACNANSADLGCVASNADHLNWLCVNERNMC